MSNAPHTEPRTVVSDSQPLAIENPRTPPEVCPHPRLSTKRASCAGAAGAELVSRLLRGDGVVYDMTAGDSDSCVVEAPLEWLPELLRHPYGHHGCDAGRLLRFEETCAALASLRGRTWGLLA